MERKTHIVTLDGLRGIAAFAVVWYHMTGQLYQRSVPSRGYLAVDFFFLLSGVVMARAYEQPLSQSMSVAHFLRIRLIRLYPMIVLGVFFGAMSKLLVHFYFAHRIGEVASMHSIILAIIFALLLLPYSGMYGPQSDFAPLDIPLWSLSFELWANILYAIIVKKMRWLIVLVIPLSAIGLIWVCTQDGNLAAGHTANSIGVGVLRVGFSFFFGVALGRYLTPGRISRLPSVTAPVLGLLLMAALMAGPSFGRFYDAAAVLIIFPVIICLGMRDHISPAWKRVASASGALSYPVYVLHYATIVHLAPLKKLPREETVSIMTAVFCVVLVISYCILHKIDMPIRNWLIRISTIRVAARTQVDGAAAGK